MRWLDPDTQLKSLLFKAEIIVVSLLGQVLVKV